MKKFFSLILALIILAISLFSVSAFAVDVEESAVETTKTELFFTELKTSDELSVEISSNEKTLFFPMKKNIILSKKDGKISICGTSKWLVEINVIVDNGLVSAYSPSIPIFYIKDYDPYLYIDLYTLFVSLTDIGVYLSNHIQSYEKTIDENNYYIEEFSDGNVGIHRYYYIDNELTKIEVINTRDESLNKTYDITVLKNVDDGLFEVPSSAIIDLSYIFPVF